MLSFSADIACNGLNDPIILNNNTNKMVQGFRSFNQMLTKKPLKRNLKNDTNKSIQAMLSYTGYFCRWHENHTGLSSCPRIRTVISARFSVTGLSCDAPITNKVESHVLDRCLHKKLSSMD